MFQYRCVLRVVQYRDICAIALSLCLCFSIVVDQVDTASDAAGAAVSVFQYRGGPGGHGQ